MKRERECCNYCMWLGPVNQDGTMRKHRPATRDDKWGRPNSVQDMAAAPCPGSNKPYARFGTTEETTEDAQETTVTETFEGVAPSDVHEGDRLQFMTRETGFNGRGLYVRTGVVAKVTAKTVKVVCGDPKSYKPDTAVLRRDLVEWHSRGVRRVVTEQPVSRPYNAANVQYVDDGLIVTAVWCSDPTVDPKVALDNSLRQDLPYEVEVIAEATRFYKKEGADFSGWVVSTPGGDYGDSVPNKRRAMQELRWTVADHFTR